MDLTPTHPASADPPGGPTADAVLDAVVSALRRGDHAGADRAWAAGGAAVDPAVPVRLAELNLRRRRWADAAWLLDRVPDPLPFAVGLKRNLCRNMAALAVHRPALCLLLADLPPTDAMTVVASATGHATVAVRQPYGGLAGLSPGNRPAEAAGHALAQLRPALEAGHSVGLAGVGDGYLLARLAGDEPPLFLGMRVAVFVVEPDPQLVLHALMVHDFAGPAGPIAQDRFAWFVGPTWLDDLRAAADADPMRPLPAVTIGFTTATAAAVRAGLAAVGAETAAADAAARERVAAYYATHDPAGLADLLSAGGCEQSRDRQGATGSEGPDLAGGRTCTPSLPDGRGSDDAADVPGRRRPRVLLLTSRFTTVLQYSTRDSAAAFERLGWDARVLIEPSAAHRLVRGGIRRAVDDFRPDLVFQIDHLRHEHEDLFPPTLPFACWIQDHLPHLTTPAAGRTVGPTDFVLAGEVPTCVHDYGYPASQCVAVTKLTNEIEVPPAGRHGHVPMSVPRPGVPGTPDTDTGTCPCHPDADAADDVVFVSNASRPPPALLAEFVAGQPAGSPAAAVMAVAAGRVLAAYAAAPDGGDVPCTYVAAREAVEAAAAGLGFRPTRDAVRQLAAWLYHPFVDALYRQQALGWAAAACGGLGLRLGLYGRGWDAHPTLAAHARGPVENGPPLRALTAAATFNLQVVPYMCLHPRLLDGLMAGGLFLVRRHLSDTAPGALIDLLGAHGDGAAGTEAAARASLAGRTAAVTSRFEASLADVRRCACAAGTEDPVEYARSWQAAGMVEPGTGVLPRFADVAFGSAAELRARMADLLADPGRRGSIQNAQRASVAARFTYDAGLGRVAAEIAARLAGRRGAGNAPTTATVEDAATNTPATYPDRAA